MASENHDIANIDKNLVVEGVADGEGFVFYNVRQAPFSLYGLYDPLGQPVFKRMPDDVAKATSPGVAQLNLHTAGGRVRFSTDSDKIAIRAVMHEVSHFPHMPMSGSGGFDLILNVPSEGGGEICSRYVNTFMPPWNMTDGYSAKIKLCGKRKRFFTINFPSYSGVVDLYVGVTEGSSLGEGVCYRNRLPVVFYGSSITQGGCSSTPGNSCQNIISRRLNLDYINLGFSGSGKAEDTIVDYMASLPMCAFVSDYDHNAPNVEHLQKTHYRMYRKIRAAHPEIPYLMLSKCDVNHSYDDAVLRRDVIFDTYRKARTEGDRNVYYIDGASVYRGPYWEMCTVDSLHPNDLGFALMADAVGAELKRVLTQPLLS